MLRSIATVSISGTLLEKLQAIKEAGFDCIELFENDLISSAMSPSEVKRVCADFGLSIALFQPFRDFEGVDRARLAQNLERAKRKFDLMNRLDTNRILVCSNASDTCIADDGLIEDQLGALAETAALFDVMVGYEALAWGSHVNRWAHSWRLVNAVNHPALGLVVDSFHVLAVGDSPVGISNIPPNRITFAQLADAPRLSMDLLEWSRHHRCFPGQGDLDVTGFTLELLKSGYQGPLSLEVFNDSFRAAPCQNTAKEAFRSLLYLEAQLERNSPAITETAVADPCSEHPAASVEGFEFVEFAVGEDVAIELATWLEQAGFSIAGIHRSKNVKLFRQGNAALVLNAESTSFASDYYKAHGPSACASAYRVRGAKSLMEHAKRMGYDSVKERRNAGETELEGVVAPDESHLYFIESAGKSSQRWEDDFSSDWLFDSMRGNPAGVHNIDHISINIPGHALDNWVLFYRSLFDAQIEPVTWLADPYGLVRSRAVRASDGLVRVILNAAAHGETTVAASVRSYAGSGLNHVALSCGDIIKTVRHLHERNVHLLPIADNYYEDLAARYGDTVPVATLAALGILYDRDDKGGEFYHAFTRPFKSRFYIEIVQRLNGYQGFGASNAVVRIAAMSALQQQQTLASIVLG